MYLQYFKDIDREGWIIVCIAVPAIIFGVKFIVRWWSGGR